MQKLLLPLFLACSLSIAQTDSTWVSLFDGQSLSGWRANEHTETWRVEDGTIVCRGKRSHLFYVGEIEGAKFKNFEFVAEVYSETQANSGIYFHTQWQESGWPDAGYECQIFNGAPLKPQGYTERKLTGSIYAVRNTWRSPVPDHRWFEYRIRVAGRTIQTFINGELISQYTEGPEHWRAKDKKGRRLGRGTFALQGHDPDSVVRFRNLRVRIIDPAVRSSTAPIADLELDELISFFSDKNFPLIDLGIEPVNPSLRAIQRRDARHFGLTLGYEVPVSVDYLPANVALFMDRDTPVTAAELKRAKRAGQKIAFSSGGDTWLNPNRIKARLQAMKNAGLAWRDLWVPGD